VRTASVLLGALNLVFCCLIQIPLIAYVADTDVPGLNPIKENEKVLENVLEDTLRGHNWTAHNYLEIMASARQYFPLVAQILAALAGISATAALFMILGVRCKVRLLMLPYLALTMVDIVVAGAGGIVIVVALFIANLIPGLVSLAVYLIVAVLSLYSWATVLAAFKIVGQEEYMPVFNSKQDHGYYPSAPQQFDMDEYRDRSHYRHRFG